MAGLPDLVDDFLVLQHVIADIFHRFELGVAFFTGNEHPRVATVEGIEIIDMKKPVDEFLEPQQVECGRRNEEYRCLVAPEISQDIG